MGNRVLYDLLQPHPGGGSLSDLVARALPVLTERWCAAYEAEAGRAEISEIRLSTFTYLFDHIAERTLVAYGITTARNLEARDRARMAGHPKSEGAEYHRGHLIPHSAGGGTDINLFSQRGSVNVGRFRRLEKLSLEFLGSFYFVRLIYPPDTSQRPAFIEQGLLVNDPRAPRYEYDYFEN